MGMWKIVDGDHDEFDAFQTVATGRGHQTTRLTAVKDEDHVARQSRQRGYFGTRDALTVKSKGSRNDLADVGANGVPIHFVDLDAHPDETVADLEPFAFEFQTNEFESEAVVDDHFVLHQRNTVAGVASIDQHGG